MLLVQISGGFDGDYCYQCRITTYIKGKFEVGLFEPINEGQRMLTFDNQARYECFNHYHQVKLEDAHGYSRHHKQVTLIGNAKICKLGLDLHFQRNILFNWPEPKIQTISDKLTVY